MTITSIRGFNDILPFETALWRRIEDEAIRVFSSCGFSEIRVPVADKTELFLRSIGETTDIVEKEMYTFADRHGESITLRPEGTAPVVRAYIEHKLYAAPVTKLFYAGPMFRYERPQKGRYRQFYQIGAEVLGDDSPRADGETIGMLVELFRRLDVSGITLHINSLGCAECRPKYKDALKGFLSGVKERLCENCQRRMDLNPLRALDCKSPKCIEATDGAPRITEHLCQACNVHFERVKHSLAGLNITPNINPRMVRGLDYYSKTTFEITADGLNPFKGLGSQNAIAAGGRYDGLVSDLGGPATPCFGFAMGMERLAIVLKDKGFKERPLVAFIALGEDAEKKGTELLKLWRNAGLRVTEDFSEAALKKRMKRVDQIGADFAVILGEDELKEGAVMLKNLKTAEQEKVKLEDVAQKVGNGGSEGCNK